MSSPVATIRTTLFNALNTLLANKAKVYSYYESNPAQYPTLLFDISSQQNDFLSNVENMSAITFKMVLLVDQSDENSGTNGLTEQQATNLLDTLTDTIVSYLETNYNLGGVVDYCSPTVGNRETVGIPNGIAKAQYINLTVRQSIFVL